MLATFRATLVLAALLTAINGRAEHARPADVLRRQLAIHWQDVPLRDVCRRLYETQGLTVFLDRRLDPRQPIGLQTNGETVRQVLERIAHSCDAQLVVLPTLCYLGPTEAAAELPTLLEISQDRLNTALPAMRRKLAQKRSVSWGRLATPRQILDDLAQHLELEVTGADSVPHDLFDAGELPMTSVADQLTLLLAPFDLMWKVDAAGKRIEIVPIERPVRIARTYHSTRTNDSRLESVLAQLPANDVSVSDGNITVNGTAEIHEKLRELLGSVSQSTRTPRRASRPSPELKRFSLRLQDQPAGAVLRELARQLNLRLQVDDEAKPALVTRISINVTQVELDALLEEIGKAAGLKLNASGAELRASLR